jgi:hypothetical protein
MLSQPTMQLEQAYLNTLKFHKFPVAQNIIDLSPIKEEKSPTVKSNAIRRICGAARREGKGTIYRAVFESSVPPKARDRRFVLQATSTTTVGVPST